MDIAKTLDVMRRARSNWEQAEKAAQAQRMTREAILNLRFRPGQKVRDKVTGEEVIVYAGTRKIATIPIPREEGAGSLPGETTGKGA